MIFISGVFFVSETMDKSTKLLSFRPKPSDTQCEIVLNFWDTIRSGFGGEHKTYWRSSLIFLDIVNWTIWRSFNEVIEERKIKREEVVTVWVCGVVENGDKQVNIIFGEVERGQNSIEIKFVIRWFNWMISRLMRANFLTENSVTILKSFSIDQISCKTTFVTWAC